MDWYCSEPRLALNRTVVLQWRIYLEQKQYAPTTINLRLAAVRRLRMRPPIPACSVQSLRPIRRVTGVRRIGVRVGNWLTAGQDKRLLGGADRDSLRGKRNYAILAMLVVSGLLRGELLALGVDAIQLREEHCGSLGKAGHMRTVPTPVWKEASGIMEGTLFRSINKTGRV